MAVFLIIQQLQDLLLLWLILWRLTLCLKIIQLSPYRICPDLLVLFWFTPQHYYTLPQIHHQRMRIFQWYFNSSNLAQFQILRHIISLNHLNLWDMNHFLALAIWPSVHQKCLLLFVKDVVPERERGLLQHLDLLDRLPKPTANLCIQNLNFARIVLPIDLHSSILILVQFSFWFLELIMWRYLWWSDVPLHFGTCSTKYFVGEEVF